MMYLNPRIREHHWPTNRSNSSLHSIDLHTDLNDLTISLMMSTEALEDGFPKERFQREPGERWRSEGTSQHVVHAGGHVLRRVRFDRLYGDIPDRREAWRGRRWHRGPRRSQEWTSIAGCARSSGLRGNRSKYAIRTICIHLIKLRYCSIWISYSTGCFGKLVIKR